MPAAPVQIPLWLDMSAVVVAALGGGLVAARANFDLTGVFGLAIITGLGGGLLRDLLLNQLPVALKSPWYLVAATAAAAVVALFSHQADERLFVLVLLDAAALGLYGMSGANKALINGLGIWPAIFIGLIAATGGGVLRDVLTAKPPSIFLRGELYATAALIGLVVYTLGFETNLDDSLIAVVGAVVTFSVRVASWRLGWRLPGPIDAPGAVRGRLRTPDDPDR